MNTYSMAVAKKIILLVPSPLRGGLGRGKFSNVIFFTVGLIVCSALTAWADNKTNPVKSEPVPIQNIAPKEVATPTAYEISWTSINGGGELASTSTNYKIRASTAQSVIGESQSTNYKMGIGFWFGTGLYCTSRPGDANGVGGINLTDVIYMVNHVFKSGPQPVPKCRGDANGNGTLNLTDIIYLVNRVFKGGPQPIKSGVCCL
ncbi:MAG: hypothetical protein RBG1_1C00001G0284 [candidate division Zixibacteria bacterium RBG-1]|nr:MAG: hypothetical protein RBG1_1C00001G0284 [candidate division Zixibacteria bacterium RBG-1]